MGSRRDRYAATQNTLDETEASRACTAADILAARAALQDAQRNLNDTRIVAPFAGRI